MKEIQPSSNKIKMLIRLLEEKLVRECELSLEELSKSTITIKGGEITIKKGK